MKKNVINNILFTVVDINTVAMTITITRSSRRRKMDNCYTTSLIYSQKLSEALQKINGETRYLRQRAGCLYYFDEHEILCIQPGASRVTYWHKQVCFYEEDINKKIYLSSQVVTRAMVKLTPYTSTINDFIKEYNKICKEEQCKRAEIEKIGQMKKIQTEVYECSLCGKQYLLSQKEECENHIKHCGRTHNSRKNIELANKRWKEGCTLSEINEIYPFFKRLPAEMEHWTKNTVIKEKEEAEYSHVGNSACKIIAFKYGWASITLKDKYITKVSFSSLKKDFYEVQELYCPYCKKQFNINDTKEYNEHYPLCEEKV